MKKLVLLIAIPGIFITGCNNSNRGEKASANGSQDSAKVSQVSAIVPKDTIKLTCTGVDMSKYNALKMDQVQEMAERYQGIIENDPTLVIQQINMDAPFLKDLLCNTDGLKLIAGADKYNNETIIIQFWKGGSFSYYDIGDLFKSTMRGMRNQPPVCPPPPGCELPFIGKNLQKKYDNLKTKK